MTSGLLSPTIKADIIESMTLRKERAIQVHEAAHFVIGELQGLKATNLFLTPICAVKWEDIKQSEIASEKVLKMIAAGEAANLKQLRVEGEDGEAARAYARSGAQCDVELVRQALVDTTFAGSDRFYVRGLELASEVIEDERVWKAILEVAQVVKEAMDESMKEVDLSRIRPIVMELQTVHDEPL